MYEVPVCLWKRVEFGAVRIVAARAARKSAERPGSPVMVKRIAEPIMSLHEAADRLWSRAPQRLQGRVPWHTTTTTTISRPFEITSKRRKSYPSETRVKRGHRTVHGGVELVEKLGRNDLCPCGSGRRFQALLPEIRTL